MSGYPTAYRSAAAVAFRQGIQSAAGVPLASGEALEAFAAFARSGRFPIALALIAGYEIYKHPEIATAIVRGASDILSDIWTAVFGGTSVAPGWADVCTRNPLPASYTLDPNWYQINSLCIGLTGPGAASPITPAQTFPQNTRVTQFIHVDDPLVNQDAPYKTKRRTAAGSGPLLVDTTETRTFPGALPAGFPGVWPVPGIAPAPAWPRPRAREEPVPFPPGVVGPLEPGAEVPGIGVDVPPIAIPGVGNPALPGDREVTTIGTTPDGRTFVDIQAFPAAWSEVRPVSPDTRETKFHSTRMYARIQVVLNAATESLDALKAVWEALPDKCRNAQSRPRRGPRGGHRKSRPHEMLWDIQNCWPKDSFALNNFVKDALKNLLANELQDAFYGRQGRRAKTAADRVRATFLKEFKGFQTGDRFRPTSGDARYHGDFYGPDSRVAPKGPDVWHQIVDPVVNVVW